MESYVSTVKEMLLKKYDGEKNKHNFSYIVPNFQREIRWEEQQVNELIDDVDHGKHFIGNVIFQKYVGETMKVLDGQQRFTTIYIIYKCFNKRYSITMGERELFDLKFDSFDKVFLGLFENEENVKLYDNLCQYKSFERIKQTVDHFFESYSSDPQKIRIFMKNLSNAQLNVLVATEQESSDIYDIFIDVNLKGKKLDIEDIFKAYLFKNDIGNDRLRDNWYLLKKSHSVLCENDKIKYPLMKLIEDYILCDSISTDFNGNKLSEGLNYRENDNKYFICEKFINNFYFSNLVVVCKEYLDFIKNVLCTEGMHADFKEFYSKFEFDDSTIHIFYYIFKKIFMDSNAVPKSLLLKAYILIRKMNNDASMNEPEMKSKKKQVADLMYSILVFDFYFKMQLKKGKSEIKKIVIKETLEEVSTILHQNINAYINSELTKKSINILALTEEEETEENKFDFFDMKTIELIYDFFKWDKKNKRFVCKNTNSASALINDPNMSKEHLIIPNGNVLSISGNEVEIPTKMKKTCNTIFNFILFDRETQGIEGENKCFWEKIPIYESKTDKNEYAKEIIALLKREETYKEFKCVKTSYDLNEYSKSLFDEEQYCFVMEALNILKNKISINIDD